MKSYILKKEAKRRSYMQGTGGGPPTKVSFSTFEEEVLELLTPEAAGLENIPEGGINREENSILEETAQVMENTEMEENMEENMHMMTEEDNNTENIPPDNNTDKRIINNTARITNNTANKTRGNKNNTSILIYT